MRAWSPLPSVLTPETPIHLEMQEVGNGCFSLQLDEDSSLLDGLVD